ncbi:hypothetical protein EVAR_58566_1 [Eumeta japonica]|uniref:Uncharacterized protein n=1 Tax=Eumeta variegata TaxID=151549 RepID=A0A4C1Z7S4_EUMVA|nr:hypothetical protein EVAR_58566_1 [Eumeta japonica]
MLDHGNHNFVRSNQIFFSVHPTLSHAQPQLHQLSTSPEAGRERTNNASPHVNPSARSQRRDARLDRFNNFVIKCYVYDIDDGSPVDTKLTPRNIAPIHQSSGGSKREKLHDGAATPEKILPCARLPFQNQRL